MKTKSNNVGGDTGDGWRNLGPRRADDFTSPMGAGVKDSPRVLLEGVASPQRVPADGLVRPSGKE